jgi:hypothetical protein
MADLPRIRYEEEGDEPDTSAPSSHFRCVDCKAPSPPTRTGETLVSSKHGWRAVRVPAKDGGFAAQWRCPPCWAIFRSSKLSSF